MSHRCGSETCPRKQSPRGLCNPCRASKRAQSKAYQQRLREESRQRQAAGRGILLTNGDGIQREG